MGKYQTSLLNYKKICSTPFKAFLEICPPTFSHNQQQTNPSNYPFSLCSTVVLLTTWALLSVSPFSSFLFHATTAVCTIWCAAYHCSIAACKPHQCSEHLTLACGGDQGENCYEDPQFSSSLCRLDPCLVN